MSEAARLLWRRVGLGAGPDRLRKHSNADETLEFLLSYSSRSDPLPGPPPFPRIPPGVVPTLLLLGESIVWWLERMARTERPMEEWLTLFWHRHFATSASKVFSPGLMLAQNQTLRRCGGGRFGELLWEIVNDPAMIIWLDLNGDNENFARELLELYTVGPGHYSEADIKSLARVFTGWGINFPSLTARFSPEKHDDGPIQVMQLRGQHTPREVLEALAVHPATARRLTGRLWRALTGVEPEEDWSPLWIRTRGDVLAVLRGMLKSKRFLASGPRVQSPLELYVASLRLLEVESVPLEHVRRLYQMGECPFLPPGVKGWGEGWDWIHPSAMLERFALLWDVVERLPDAHPRLRELDALPQAVRSRAALRLAEGWPLSSNLPDELSRHQGAPRRLLGVLLCSPDFQVS